MLLHGDELGRTQQGNNNTYCQDSELSWVHWDAMDQPLVEFTAVVNKIRHDHPTFRRSRFFDGRPVRRGEGEKLPDIVWLNTDGKEMLPEDWDSGFGRTIGVFYNGHGIQEQDSRGRRITDDSFLLGSTPMTTTSTSCCPAEEYTPFWDVLVDTADQADTGQPLKAGCVLRLAAKSLVVLRAYSGPEVEVDYSAAASLAARAEAPEETAAAAQAEHVAEAEVGPAAEAARRAAPAEPALAAGCTGACARSEPAARRHEPLRRSAPRASATGAEGRQEAAVQEGPGFMRTPVSTYRLQIRPGFTLQDAAQTVPYLKSLGVDWIYLSPILTAERGSDHGYDVTDPSAIDPDRGGADGLLAASTAAREAGMGVLVDIVPNHVGVATPVQNPWWWSLLKEGQQSRYAQAFDVDWDFGGGRVRIPVLGADSDVDALEINDGELRYYDHRFPLAEGTYTAGDPLPMTPRGPRPAALRADRLAPGGHGPELPPVLCRQQPGRDPGGAPGGLR